MIEQLRGWASDARERANGIEERLRTDPTIMGAWRDEAGNLRIPQGVDMERMRRVNGLDESDLYDRQAAAYEIAGPLLRAPALTLTQRAGLVVRCGDCNGKAVAWAFHLRSHVLLISLDRGLRRIPTLVHDASRNTVMRCPTEVWHVAEPEVLNRIGPRGSKSATWVVRHDDLSGMQ